MYVSIYKKIFNAISSTPPSETPDASNLGEIRSGSGNSLWECKSRIEGVLTDEWNEISVNTPVAPSRSPLASDVGNNVTAEDGSIWTAVQSGSTSQLKWTATGNSTAFEPTTCVYPGTTCSIENDIEYSCLGSDNGGVIEYAELKCQYVTTYTYTWQLVQPRKSCASCPPSQGTIDGDQCYCSSLDKVYEYTYENNQVTTYYWQKVREATVLSVEIDNIIKHVSGTITKKAISDDEGSFKGYLESEITDPFMFTLHDDVGKTIYSGFIKNWDYKDLTHQVSFDLVDLRTIFDTQVMLDFSNDETFDSSLSTIFQKVATALTASAGNLNYQFTIPTDERSTTDIANYSDQYIVVNAKEFLRVYLVYYRYYITASFDPDTLTIKATFNEANEEVLEIKLDDFTFEKTQTSIKSNHTIATIKFQTIYEIDSEWSTATEIDYTTAAIEDKGVLMADELPPLEGYNKDFVLKLVKGAYFEEITEAEYNALSIKQEASIKLTSGNSTPGQIVQSDIPYANLGQARYLTTNASPVLVDGANLEDISFVYQDSRTIQSHLTISVEGALSLMDLYEEGSACEFDKNINLYWRITNMYGTFTARYQACQGYIKYACPISAPTVQEITQNFDPTSLAYEQGLKVQYKDSNDGDCQVYRYVKVVSDDVEYWKKGGTLVIPRPASLARKHYYLGSDNNIYSGSIPDDLKVYPVKSKIFEYETLAKAQIEAIYELVSTRWNQSIKIDNLKKPIDLNKDFLQMVKVYDKNGDYMLLPISEKYFDIEEIITNEKIKLGFKVDFFWQLYNENESKGVIK